MIFRVIFALLFVFAALGSDAQDHQYIVKLTGDTLRGNVQINPNRDNSTSMYLKYEDGTKEYIYPLRISYVYYDEDIQFRSVPFHNNQRLFMQIIKEDDYLSYYNYIHKRDNSMATAKIAIKPNGEVLELSALTFKKQVSEFLDDCPEIVARIEAKYYKYRDVDLLFADYNDCDLLKRVASQQPANTAPAVSSSQRETATSTATGTTINTENKTNTQPLVASETTQSKLESIDAFRRYVRTLGNFEHSRDLLEWLADIEYRVSQDQSIPNYLWSSLQEMSEDHQELREKAQELQNQLVN